MLFYRICNILHAGLSRVLHQVSLVALLASMAETSLRRRISLKPCQTTSYFSLRFPNIHVAPCIEDNVKVVTLLANQTAHLCNQRSIRDAGNYALLLEGIPRHPRSPGSACDMVQITKSVRNCNGSHDGRSRKKPCQSPMPYTHPPNVTRECPTVGFLFWKQTGPAPNVSRQ